MLDPIVILNLDIQEQHGGSGRSGDAEEEDQPNTPGAESVEAIIKKREYVLRELVDTEEIYVTDLRLICEGYMRHMQVRLVSIHHFAYTYISYRHAKVHPQYDYNKLGVP